MTDGAIDRPTIRILFAGAVERPGSFRYRVSQVEIRTAREIEELTPFAVSVGASDRVWTEEPSWVATSRDLPVVYDGSGCIGGREVRVLGRAAGVRHCLEIEDGTILSLAEQDGECFLWVTVGSDPMASRLAVLGPGLAVALALLGCFSLHAGAVMVAGSTLVIMGKSGSGKSTMSAFASERSGCRRVADDVVPVRVSPRGEMTVVPRFPQLKLVSTAQWTGESALICRTLLCLTRDSGARVPEFSELSTRDGVLRLLESTVASRLFSMELRERELDAWALAAARNHILDWRVPEDPDRLVEIFASLASFRC